MSHLKGVLLDIDGTLVDSNDAHAQAWIDALREFGYDEVPFEKVRRLIGKGGDKLLPECTGQEKDSPQGKQISQRRGQIFKEKYLPHLKAFPATRELLARMKQDGLKLVVATSAQEDEMKELLEIAGAADMVAQKANSSDAKNSKPDPDIIQAALDKAGYTAQDAVMLGDTPYDVEAAGKANVPTIALRSGGWQDEDLKEAIAIYNDPADLLAHYEGSPLHSA